MYVCLLVNADICVHICVCRHVSMRMCVYVDVLLSGKTICVYEYGSICMSV